MTPVSFDGKTLLLDDLKLSLEHVIRDAFAAGGKIIVLLDPDSYLTDPAYGQEQRRGKQPVHNLIALSKLGNRLWEAEFPEDADYYYRIVSTEPLIALSFSSYRCELDLQTGRIVAREFLK